MPTTITTSNNSLATAAFNGRHLDRTQDGTLWSVQVGSSAGTGGIYLSYSKDNGATWTRLAVGPGSTAARSNPSLFIDVDDYAHLVLKDGSSGSIEYYRGTPNAARTAWTWSAAVTILATSTGDYPDVIAHREGTEWRAHVVFSVITGGGADNSAQFRRVNIAADGTLTTPDNPLLLGGSYAVAAHTYPSIDFNHTGDGKTVQGGTPHLYVGWTAGATGAGKGVRFRKATYSAGSWTWNPEREIDPNRRIGSSEPYAFLTTMFDGTRALLVGAPYEVAIGTGVPTIYERDAADTTTTTRTLLSSYPNEALLSYGSSSYDGAGNVYLFGRDNTGANGSRLINRRKWTRSTQTLGPIETISTSGPDAPYLSAQRGHTADTVRYVWTEGTASPYTVLYGSTAEPALSTPKTITTSTAATATAAFNGRKVDRCQDGTLVAAFNTNVLDPLVFRYSKDNGATWAAAAPDILNANNSSTFVDVDDHLHVAFKATGATSGAAQGGARSNGVLYYMRGVPNAARTAWTWSAAVTVEGNTDRNFPDVAACRNPSTGGWDAFVVSGTANAEPQNHVYYRRIPIAADGTIGTLSFDGLFGGILGGDYDVNAHPYPSIDFHHDGGGKTVQGGTPHLYVGWTAGTTGTGKGVRFRKAVYSAGSWTWNPEREIDPNNYATPNAWLVTFFDGTRVVLAGDVVSSTSFNLRLYERDAADTTTTTRVLLNQGNGGTVEPDLLIQGSASYDAQGNVYLFGRDTSGASGTRKVNWRKWTRQGATLGPINTFDATGSDAPYLSAKRGSQPGNSIEVVYTDGTASPYNVNHYTAVDKVNALLTGYTPAIML